MLYLKQSVILINIFFVIVQSKKYYRYQPRSTEGTTTSPFSENSVKYSPELIKDLDDFINLIPKAVVDELVAEHYLLDSGFRKAIAFLRSSQLKQLQRQAEQMPEIINLINYAHINDTTTMPSVHRVRRNSGKVPQLNSDIVVFVLMPSVYQRNWHSFISFAEELLTHLPRQKYVDLIKEKSEKSALFTKFYQAIRSPQFKPMVEEAMATPNVKSLISTLNNNAIDAKSLKDLAFQVISWGPAI